MGKNREKIILISMVYCLWSIVHSPDVKAKEALDYLILQSIGDYHNSGKGKCGEGSGIIAATGHYGEDHNDLTCRTGYYNKAQDLAISIVVTQHTGSESDRWLLHEVEHGFRFGDYEEDMSPSRFRKINGNNIFYTKLGGGTYRWIHNNIVISIEYVDLYQQKPEPLEVVNSYLAKFPSTIPDMTIDSNHAEQWLKDEMERRVWLAEKWIALIKAQNKQEELRNVREHLEVFLKYREKYLGEKIRDKEISGLYKADEKEDIVGMEERVKGYREWWEANKTKPLRNVPGGVK
jgi:hypothetical protein